MTEGEWLQATNPDAMLRLIGGRFSPRRWQLLACAAARRASDALPDGPFRDALDWVERRAGKLPKAKAKRSELEKLIPAAIESARQSKRAVVLPADPDADPDDFRHSEIAAPNPSAALFQSACRNAAAAVEHAGEAAETAAHMVLALIADKPGPDVLERVRAAVIEATRLRGAANLHATAALELKARGDDSADRGPKNLRVQYSAALETVRKFEEQISTKINELEEQKRKADRRAVARYVLDMTGNPFRPYRFEPSWRTKAVTRLAITVFENRAFDRMAELAEALLDADCDEEAVLRHCRGTEPHAPDGPAHIRGCWVLDLVLEREPGFFAHPPLDAPRPPPPPKDKPAGKTTTRDPLAQLFEAIKRGTPLPDDDEED